MTLPPSPISGSWRTRRKPIWWTTPSSSSYGKIASISIVGIQRAVSHGVRLPVVRYGGSSAYCLSAKSSAFSNTWHFDSRAGGLRPKGTADLSGRKRGDAQCGSSVTKRRSNPL